MLMIYRGLPGSGKSTAAAAWASRNPMERRHVEADEYFVHKDGVYRYDSSLLSEAHEWCRTHVRKHLRAGFDVVVSNTFTRPWEMQPYFDILEEFHAGEAKVYWFWRKFGSIHGVPDEAMRRMAARWEKFPNEIKFKYAKMPKGEG